jgi:inorganic phosphate transporter, PiT family
MVATRPHQPALVAAVIGAYMAMNIGANDVANNVGPAVGARAMTMARPSSSRRCSRRWAPSSPAARSSARSRAASSTRGKIGDAAGFVWLMMAALLAGALWLNLRDLHRRAGLDHPFDRRRRARRRRRRGRLGLANWGTLGQIAASWVVSPVFGGLIAAVLLYLIKRTITYQAT